jgi:subtilase family serine protease
VEQLEDRTLASATPLAGAALMQPTYRLVHASTGARSSNSLSAPVGLTPMQVRGAYGFDPIVFPGGVAADGSGQTIAIVDAFDDPTAATDLTAFDQQFGLTDPAFSKVGINAAGQASTSRFPSPDPDWSVEIALDIEWAHAIAPGARILLVEANSNNYPDLLAAVDYARAYPGVTAVSMSWGGAEFSGETAMDHHFTTPAGHAGVTCRATAAPRP